MPALNLKTSLTKPLSETILIDSPLCLIDAYETYEEDEVFEIDAKTGAWQAQAGFADYREYQHGYMVQGWGARIAQALVEAAAGDFTVLEQVGDIFQSLKKQESVATALAKCGDDNVTVLQAAFEGVESGFKTKEGDAAKALLFATELLHEQRDFSLHSFKRPILVLQGNLEQLAEEDQRVMQITKVFTDKTVEFYQRFLNSVASKSIQFIQLKHESQTDFSKVDSEQWKTHDSLSTSSGRLGLVTADWLSTVNENQQALVLQELSIEEDSYSTTRNPSNFRKVDSASFGIGSITLHRDSYNDLYVRKNEAGEVVEILLSFDNKYED